MKYLLAIFFLILTAHATTILDARTNVYNFTNSISVGSVTISNQINTTISSGAVVIAGGAFTGAVFNPQTTLAGVSNVTFLGGLTGGITSGTLTVNGSTAALGVSAPTSGSYIAQSDSGTITWQPLANIGGTNLNATVYASPYGVTNIFTVAGRTTQTWTWSGGTTNIMIKAWGAGGGCSANSAAGNGGFILVVLTVTNGKTFNIQVPFGGAINLTQYVSEVNNSWPGGGVYATNATTARGGGGGYAAVYSDTNIILIAGGGAGSAGSGSGASAHGGWPNGANSAFGLGGTQTAGGSASGTALSGSYLQGGNSTSGVYQAGGGGGYYGGGGSGSSGLIAGGGGSSYWNPNYILYGYGVVSLNSGDLNYSSSYGTGGTIGNGQNGLVLIITPTP